MDLLYALFIVTTIWNCVFSTYQCLSHERIDIGIIPFLF